MTQLSNILANAARNVPTEMRFVLKSSGRVGDCGLEVLECVDVGEVTVSLRGPQTIFYCTDLQTGQREPVAVIEGESDGKTTFDLSRYLPKRSLSRLFNLYRTGCGLQMYWLQGEACAFPLDPQSDLDIIWLLGELTFENDYTLSAMIVKDHTQGAPIEETLSVSATRFLQVSKKDIGGIASFGTAPLVGVTEIQSGSCATCEECDTYAIVGTDGIVGFTENLFSSTPSFVNVLPNLGSFVPTDIHAFNGNVVVSAADTGGNVGKLWVTTAEDLTDGTPSPTWVEITADSDGTDLLELNKMANVGGTLWIVGDAGGLYSYNSLSGVVTARASGTVQDLNDIHFRGDYGIIAGDADVALYSQNKGANWLVIEVIDPATGIATSGIDFLSCTIGEDGELSWEVGTDDGRAIYTLNAGANYYSQVLPGVSAAGSVVALEMDRFGVVYASVIEAGAGTIYTSYYGFCGNFREMPEGTGLTVPENDGMNDLVICGKNTNFVTFAGLDAAGTASQIITGTVSYA